MMAMRSGRAGEEVAGDTTAPTFKGSEQTRQRPAQSGCSQPRKCEQVGATPPKDRA